jgi:hypothetical protein
MMDDQAETLDRAFSEAKTEALGFVAGYNASLPSQACPECGDAGHVPGLRCPACGYKHDRAWAILRDTEWGYDVVWLTNRKKVLASFRIKE